MNQNRSIRSLASVRSFTDSAVGPSEILAFSGLLTHVYIKLDLESQFENAATAEDAKAFLRSVARASILAEEIAKTYNGMVLEVQGSNLHVSLAADVDGSSSLKEFAAALHVAYKATFANPSRVQGWRMTSDTGNTLVIRGSGIHGDDSLVSLGDSANEPAKHLYAELDKAEDKRDLKRYYLGACNQIAHKWEHVSLDSLPIQLNEVAERGKEVRALKPSVELRSMNNNWELITESAAPISPAGTPNSPSADRPTAYFGWVMRADLDGYTKRVHECFGQIEKLEDVARQFHHIMTVAEQFTDRHEEEMVQLPWAGDNFTAASVYAEKDGYDRAIPKKLVELALDFDRELCDVVKDCGYGGWAFGIAGGEVHGNASGNIFIGGIEFDNRRALVGAGEGFGRSFQAFSSVDPDGGQIAAYTLDVNRLDDEYRSKFKVAKNSRGEVSTLFKLASTDEIETTREDSLTAAASVEVTSSRGPEIVTSRPHARR
jgi:hypothetical protein